MELGINIEIEKIEKILLAKDAGVLLKEEKAEIAKNPTRYSNGNFKRLVRNWRIILVLRDN